MIGLARERFTKNHWSDRASAQKPRLVTVANESDQARHSVDRALEARGRRSGGSSTSR